MTRIEHVGNLPKVLSSFLTGVLSGEKENAEVYECHYDEIIKAATTEKLEPQIIIDKKNTGRAFLCAVGASVRNSILYLGNVSLKPIFYYSELDEPRRKEFQISLREARTANIEKHRAKLKLDAMLKEQTRQAGEKLRESKLK